MSRTQVGTIVWKVAYLHETKHIRLMEYPAHRRGTLCAEKCPWKEVNGHFFQGTDEKMTDVDISKNIMPNFWRRLFGKSVRRHLLQQMRFHDLICYGNSKFAEPLQGKTECIPGLRENILREGRAIL